MGHADLEMIQGLSIHQLTYVSRFSSYLWGAEDLKQLRSEISKHDKYDGDHVAFSPDHQFVATSSGYKAKGIVRLWSIAEQSLISEQSICPEKRVNYLTFSPDRQKIAVACADPVFEERGEPYIQVWDVSIPKGSLTKLSGYGLYIMVMYSPDGRFLAAAGNNVDVWNAGTGEFLFGVYGDSFQGLGTQSVAFSPDGKILTIGLKDGSVEFWSVPEGKQLRVLRMSNFKPLGGQIAYNPVHALAFSPDGKLLAIGLDDGSIHLWGIQ
jgi:WD40 repeat protein